MTYERFSELWDEHVTNRPSQPPTHAVMLPEHRMRPETMEALIEYGRGDTSKIDAIRAHLAQTKDTWQTI